MNEVFDLSGAAAALGIGMLIGLERERHKGTTAEQLLHRAPCSVLAIKPQQPLQS